MHLQMASTHVNNILEVLAKHRCCLEKPKKLLNDPTPEMLAARAALSGEEQFLKDENHLFAVQCKLDRRSTELLLRTYKRTLIGCQDKIERIIQKIKAKDTDEHSKVLLYLRDLEKVLDHCIEQLNFELQLNLYPAVLPLPYTAVAQYVAPTGTSSFYMSPPQQVSGVSAPVQAPPQTLFSAGSGSGAAETGVRNLHSELLPEELLMELRSDLKEQEMEALFTRLLKALEQRITPGLPKKKGRPGKNARLEFDELVHVVLLTKFHLVLIKGLGCDRTYQFLALLGGGNEKDAAEYIRNFNKKKEDRDPKYDLEGRHEELVERTLRLIGHRLHQQIKRFLGS